VSAGFDAHRNDPITQMGLSSGDYPLMMQRILQLVPTGRQLVMLEGGYDLDALRMSTASTLAAMVGEQHNDEQPTTGGPTESAQQLAAIESHWKERF
jgi:acetoin utilization deacetylase AcuC-like enzyme